MSEEVNFVRDLAVILISAGIFTIISKALKQPTILGYIIAGFLIGPNISFFPGISSMESVHQWSEIGIIFLMFGLGLEFSFKKLLKSGNSAIFTALCKFLGGFIIGFVTGQALGWSTMESVFLGGMLPMSSTMVIIKNLDEMGYKKKPFAATVFGALVIEDIIAIVLMVIFSTMAVSNKFSGTQLLGAISKLLICLIIWFVVGIYLIPTLFKKARKFLSSEILLLVSIGLCFGMVALAEGMGFSSALGAFIMGSILAETIESEQIEKMVHPIQDLFGAIFFVSAGMMVSPASIAQNWAVILLLVVAVIVINGTFATGGVLLSGKGLEHALYSGFALGSLGEFAFIIAGVGVSLGVVGDNIYPIIVSTFVISNLLAPYTFKIARPYYNFLKRKLPATVLEKIDSDRKEEKASYSEKSAWKEYFKVYLLRVVLYSVVIITISYITRHWLEPALAGWFPHWSSTLMSIVNTCITLVAIAPFVYGLAIDAGSINKKAAVLIRQKHSNLFLILALSLVRTLLAVNFVIGIITTHIHLGAVSMVMLFIGAIVFILLGKSLFKQGNNMEKRFFDNLNGKEIDAKINSPVTTSVQEKLAGYDVHIEPLELSPQSQWIGKRLSEIPLRSTSGANIIKISRGKQDIIIPTHTEVLYPYDKVLAVGSSEQIEALRQMFEDSEDSPADNSDIEFCVKCITLSAESRLCGHSLRNANLRKYKCMVISVLHGEEFITNPDPQYLFCEGDKVWLAGEEKIINILG